MFRFFHRKSRGREIYFHEDDYCQQQLLPREAAEHVGAEIKAIGEFADAHRAPGGAGWTDMYVREEGAVELGALGITREEFAAAVSALLPPYDVVFTGYGTYRQRCKRTTAWGRSAHCALFVDGDDTGIVADAWTDFFEQDDTSIDAATKAVAALGRIRPLIYVDWAWGYLCEATDAETFASMLRKKLGTLAENPKSSKKG